ncbi:hypothetical protein [Rhizobium rhizogenes]|uniref:hypothetical protein n=1 Tax=Rhizobium rhizogenes TaxID=359 RepID=UPI00226EA6A9|nr:hypothetical protein [Rhizobium rhizogenes]
MNQTSLRLRVVPRYPAKITATDGIKAVRDGVDLTVKSDYSDLVQVPTVSNPDRTFMLAWDSDIDNYQSVSFTNIINNIQDAIIGPPLAAIDAANPGANQVVYFTAPGVAANYTVSPYVRGISNAADQTAFLSGIGAATAAQGAKADTALQPAAIGITIASAAQGAKADTALQPSDLSTTATVSKGLQAYNVDGSGIPGVAIPSNGLILRQSAPTGTSVHALRVERFSNYLTGTTGFENAAILARNIVSASATDSYEDAGLFILDNSSPGPSQNAAGRFVGNKKSTGSTWSLANETSDSTGAANPTGGLLGIEQIISANGTDGNNTRVGYDSVISRPNNGGVFSGATVEGAVAYRAVNQVADSAANRWKIAFQARTVASGGGFDCAFDSSQATLTATGFAFRMANGQRFAFTTNGDRYMRYAAASIRFFQGTIDHFIINDDGSIDPQGVIKVQGTQVVTSRRTGWTADTGTAKRTANATYSGTAEAAYTQATIQTLMNTVRDLSQTIKALKDDLITHGLIGA